MVGQPLIVFIGVLTGLYAVLRPIRNDGSIRHPSSEGAARASAPGNDGKDCDLRPVEGGRGVEQWGTRQEAS